MPKRRALDEPFAGYDSREKQKHEQSVSSEWLWRREEKDILDDESVADKGAIRPTDH
jgi:hypothetical protein